MRAEIRMQSDVTIVHLIGHLDFGTAESFQRSCLASMKGRVIFDFQNLTFVGSSGITAFVEVLLAFKQRVQEKPKFSAVGSEFKKILAVSLISDVEIYEDAHQAVLAFDQPKETGFVVESIPFPNADPPWIEDSEVLEELPREIFPVKEMKDNKLG